MPDQNYIVTVNSASCDDSLTRVEAMTIQNIVKGVLVAQACKVMMPNERIRAIKEVRTVMNCGLLTGKRIIDEVWGPFDGRR